MNETFEAYALGGAGAAKGVYKEILAPHNKDLALVLGVVATGVALGYLLDKKVS